MGTKPTHIFFVFLLSYLKPFGLVPFSHLVLGRGFFIVLIAGETLLQSLLEMYLEATM